MENQDNKDENIDSKRDKKKGKPKPLVIDIQKPADHADILRPKPEDVKNDQAADPSLEKRRLDRKVSHNRYSNIIKSMNITNEQKEKLNEFLMRRVLLENLSNEDFAIEGELGAGNGGVVQKVRHRKTGIEMAKKVFFFK
jgi:hypothetical protein